MYVSSLRRDRSFFESCVGPSVRNIFGYAARQQQKVLQDDRDE
jgi:hypothetical protein